MTGVRKNRSQGASRALTSLENITIRVRVSLGDCDSLGAMSRRQSIPPRVALLALFVFAWTAATALQSPSASQRWYKGNLHTHTINSDGDSSPDAVARWYKEHRYDFLALTDHNYFTDRLCRY